MTLFSLRQCLPIGAGFILLLFAGCYDEPPTESVSEEVKAEQPGFSGKVSGAVEGEISGPGVATYLPPQDTVDGVRAGYYLIANDRGSKELVITFRVPDGTKPGTYDLLAADPMDLGEKFELRVETMVDGTLTSYGFDTKGTLTLEVFPSEGSKLAGSKVQGTFQFETKDAEGEKLSGQGAFEFLA